MKESEYFLIVACLESEVVRDWMKDFKRTNGWIFVSLADMLEKFSADRNVMEERKELSGMFREFAESLLRYQDEEGLWHQVIDHPESYPETSATAMFLWGMSVGVRLGILTEKEFSEAAKRAYIGLLRHKIDAQGNVYGVCRGSGMSMDVEYYKQLGPVTNDDHGTGLILAAFEAYSQIEAMRNEG